jgi:hypothetical protein
VLGRSFRWDYIHPTAEYKLSILSFQDFKQVFYLTGNKTNLFFTFTDLFSSMYRSVREIISMGEY